MSFLSAASATSAWQQEERSLDDQEAMSRTLLAQLDVKGDKMDFYLLGDSQGTEPLQFTKR